MFNPVTINLKYGPMVITVEPTSDGKFQRVARYSLVNHPTHSSKTLTSKGKPYRILALAATEAKKYIANQEQVKQD